MNIVDEILGEKPWWFQQLDKREDALVMKKLHIILYQLQICTIEMDVGFHDSIGDLVDYAKIRSTKYQYSNDITAWLFRRSWHKHSKGSVNATRTPIIGV